MMQLQSRFTEYSMVDDVDAAMPIYSEGPMSDVLPAGLARGDEAA